MRVSAIAVMIWVLSSYEGKAESWADLEIESIQIQPPRVTSETAVAAVASLRNTGSEPAGNFHATVSLFRKNKKIKTISHIPVLSDLPRSGTGLSVPVKLGKLEQGEYHLAFRVDSDQEVQESNENNNEKKQTFVVWGPSYETRTY